tara:strand:- start:629 stop:865 length:237 start_codon:yes stop_codon:yes gene_type:complete
MAEVWGFFAMENRYARCARDRDLGNMPTNQGKLDNGEWRCSFLVSCARDRDLGNMPTNQGKLDNGEWRCSFLVSWCVE